MTDPFGLGPHDWIFKHLTRWYYGCGGFQQIQVRTLKDGRQIWHYYDSNGKFIDSKTIDPNLPEELQEAEDFARKVRLGQFTTELAGALECGVVVVAIITPGPEDLAVVGGIKLINCGGKWWKLERGKKCLANADEIAKAEELLEAGKAQTVVRCDEKIAKQMPKRGWTEDDILDVIQNPDRTFKHPLGDTRNRSCPEPATAYARGDDTYIVVNDRTGEIVQVSNCNDPGWLPVFKEEGWVEQ